MPSRKSDIGISVAVVEANRVERGYLLALVGSVPGVVMAGEYSEITAALRGMRSAAPAVALVDTDTLDGAGGEAWLRELHRQCPRTAVILLSAGLGPEQMIRCLEQGVAAWLEKPCPADQLCRAILLVNEGGAMLSSQAANVLLQYFRARGASIETLSRREREVLAYLSRGSPVQEIARGLKVTKGTIRTHMHRIFVKLGVKSQAEALAKYFNSANLHQPPAAESAAKRAQPAAAPPEAPHPAPLCQTHA